MDNKSKALALCVSAFADSSHNMNCFTVMDKLRVQHIHSLIVRVYVCSLKCNWSAVKQSLSFWMRTFMK